MVSGGKEGDSHYAQPGEGGRGGGGSLAPYRGKDKERDSEVLGTSPTEKKNSWLLIKEGKNTEGRGC